jgi:hypothetical protein
MPVVYAYVLEDELGVNIFTWPNVVKKFIRDTYTVNGVLALPPRDVLKLRRYKVNPRAGGRTIIDYIDVEHFLAH